MTDTPNADLRQHNDLRVRYTDDNKRALAINTRIDQLRKAGRIDENQYVATQRLYQDWAFGIEGASDRDMMSGTRASGAPGGMTQTQLDAATNFRTAMKAVKGEFGETAAHVLLLSVCLDYSYAKVAKATGMSKEEAPVAVAICIKALAAHYEVLDSARKLEKA